MKPYEIDIILARDVCRFKLRECFYPSGMTGKNYEIVGREHVTVVGEHWRPTRDLRHAWEVVEALGQPFFLQLKDGGALAVFRDYEDKKIEIEHQRPAMAICLGVLAVLGI